MACPVLFCAHSRERSVSSGPDRSLHCLSPNHDLARITSTPEERRATQQHTIRLCRRNWLPGRRWVTSGLGPLSATSVAGAIYSHCFGFLFWYRFKQRTNGVVVMRSLSKRVAFVCILLTFWSAIAFITHHHSSANDAAKCAVCVAAHSASPKTTSNLQKAIFVALSTVQTQPVSAKHRLVVFALRVRPPPEV
jgi:hypothetical protein